MIAASFCGRALRGGFLLGLACAFTSCAVQISAEEPFWGACLGEPIDDLDDGDLRIAPVHHRDGTWFTFHDAEATTLHPKPFSVSAGGPAHSKHAARISGIARKHEGPSGMGFRLSAEDVYDASRYEGMRFTARGVGRVRFVVTDVETDPKWLACPECLHAHFVEVPLSRDWRCYVVPFSRLQWGSEGDRHAPLVRDRIERVAWLVPGTERVFDVWVDNVEFINCGE